MDAERPATEDPATDAPVSDTALTQVVRLLEATCPACGAQPGDACTGGETIADLPVPLHEARQVTTEHATPFKAARRRLGLTPLLLQSPHDPAAAAVIAATLQCHPCFADAWPDLTPEEDHAFRIWMRRSSVDKAWNERVADLTGAETAWHDTRHEHEEPVRPRRNTRSRVSINLENVQRRLNFTKWQIDAAFRLEHLPPWIFTAGRREWTATLIDTLDRDAIAEQLGDQRPLSPTQTKERLRTRIGSDFPVHVGLLVKRGHLRPVGRRYGAPTFLPQDVDDLAADLAEQAVMAPSPPVPAQHKPVPAEREPDPFPPGYFEERYEALYPQRRKRSTATQWRQPLTNRE